MDLPDYQIPGTILSLPVNRPPDLSHIQISTQNLEDHDDDDKDRETPAELKILSQIQQNKTPTSNMLVF